jgi:2-amino-4-hydroxy-6-hydroxymethyldihydropteridine diphosphokinase
MSKQEQEYLSNNRKNKIWLSFGSNIGNRKFFIEEAVRLIREKNLIQNIIVSEIIETKALVRPQSPAEWANMDYLNAVACGFSSLEPNVILAEIEQIEIDLGRDYKTKGTWAPRQIDIDILLYEENQVDSEKLIIPHIQLKNRDFLLRLIESLEKKK